MAERPTNKQPKAKNLVENVTSELIKGTTGNKSKEKYQKLIVWDAEMKAQIEEAAKTRGMTVAGFIKYCVAKEMN